MRTLKDTGEPHEADDAGLLRRYVVGKSEAVFAELVRRHLPAVYAFALPRVGGDAHLAKDVVQVVFTTLARKAGTLTDCTVLGGWLCRAAHFAARDIVRSEIRRRAREREAQRMHESSAAEGAQLDWEKLQPTLAEAMGELNDADRDAVWLRYFETRPFAEVGVRLGLTENAVRMRVERALDKLRTALARRGLTSTSAVIGAALAHQAGIAAPAGLAATVTGAALTTTAGAAGWAAIFMSMTKLQVGIVVAAVLAGAALCGSQAQDNAALRRELAARRPQTVAISALRDENRRLAAASAEIESLRRDDAELQQLAQIAVDLRKAAERRVRAAATPPPNRRREMEVQMMANDRRAQEEVDRMKREIDVLAAETRQLTERGDNEAARVKFAQGQRMNAELRQFVQNTRRALSQRAETMRRLMPEGAEASILPPDYPTVGGAEFREPTVPGSAPQWQRSP